MSLKQKQDEIRRSASCKEIWALIGQCREKNDELI